MRLTNTMNLPQPFVSAATRDYQYKPGRYSATAMLKGTCQSILERRHADEVETDVADMVWAIFGTAVHSILQNAEEASTQLKENWLSVPMGDGYELSGIFDLYDDATGTVTDYKTASVWKVKFDCWDNWEPKPDGFGDWRDQTLIYCWMLRNMGFDAHRGEIVAILKDHSKTKARIGEHPPVPVFKVAWDFDDADFAYIEGFLRDKFSEIQAFEQLPDEELPPCTEKERWHKPDKWAVKKAGLKRARKLFDDGKAAEEQAQAWAEAEGKPYEVEHRPGEDGRCAEYCPVHDFCPYYRASREEA